MSLHDDVIEIEMAFIEKRNRGTGAFECFLEVLVCPESPCPCQMIYPLGSTWDEVKATYPTFTDIMEQINALHEISRELDEIRIIKLEGDEGLYDQNVDEWNSNIKENV
jgi:hypothetical protein